MYTWTAIDADTKLVPCWHVDTRDAQAEAVFIEDLSSRLAHRVQLTTDGDAPLREAARKYSPSQFTGSRVEFVAGFPDPDHISTSYVERQNLTMRMHMRRFTWLTNALSKKVENHMHGISLHFMYYNFAKVHKTLRVTPAIENGITDHV